MTKFPFFMHVLLLYLLPRMSYRPIHLKTLRDSFFAMNLNMKKNLVRRWVSFVEESTFYCTERSEKRKFRLKDVIFKCPKAIHCMMKKRWKWKRGWNFLQWVWHRKENKQGKYFIWDLWLKVWYSLGFGIKNDFEIHELAFISN